MSDFTLRVMSEDGTKKFEGKISINPKDVLILQVPNDTKLERMSEIQERFTEALLNKKRSVLVITEDIKLTVLSINEKRT